MADVEFFSLIISNCYDGQLYSFLASESYPITPDSLRGLASANLPVLTISPVMMMENGTHRIGSSLMNLLRPNNIRSKNNTENSSSNNALKFPKYYGELASKMHFIQSPGHRLENITQKILDFGKDQNSSDKRFAIVDTEYNVKMLDPILEMAEDRKVIKRQSIKDFNSCQGWLRRKFIAYSRIQWVLWQIDEGGFRQFWDDNAMIFSQLRLAKRMMGKGNGNMMAYMQQSGKGDHQEEDPKPMSVSAIWGVMRMCMIMISCSVGIYIGEREHFKLRFFMSGELIESRTFDQVLIYIGVENYKNR